MARLFQESEDTKSAFAHSKVQMFFCGGHGGTVTYDGEGGAMAKNGGPIDRVFIMRTDGKLVGDAALDIVYGCIDFSTGPLKGKVRTQVPKKKDAAVFFQFQENSDKYAFEIRGGVRELHLDHETTLVHGSVAESQMVWETGNVSGKHSTLPYVAWHPEVRVNPDLMKWFGLSRRAKPLGALAGWCKTCSPKISFSENTAKGVPFRTQQHLGHLQVLF